MKYETTLDLPETTAQGTAHYYVDDNPASQYYGKVYLLVRRQEWFGAVSLSHPCQTRCGWQETPDRAVSGSCLGTLTPIRPPGKITIEIKP